MDRNEYLTRCRECAKITARVLQMKWQLAVPEELLVWVYGSAYIPYGLKIWFDTDGNVHQDAELLDGFHFCSMLTIDLKNLKGAKE